MMPLMKPTNRIIIVVIAILLSVASIWYAQRRDAKQELGTPAVSLQPLASVSPLVVAYEPAASDWKVYASASAGFKVSYPANWTPGVCGAGCVAWAPAGSSATSFAVGIVRSNGTLADVLKQAEPFLVAKEEITAGANKWTKLTLQQPTTGDIITSHFIVHGGKLFEFGTATSDKKILDVYGAMIRSFVFTR